MKTNYLDHDVSSVRAVTEATGSSFDEVAYRKARADADERYARHVRKCRFISIPLCVVIFVASTLFALHATSPVSIFHYLVFTPVAAVVGAIAGYWYADKLSW